MKIAICLSGQPRSGIAASQFIKDYFKCDPTLIEVDYFCHTWTSNEWKTDASNIPGQELHLNETIEINAIQELFDKFSPKASQYNNYNVIDNYTTNSRFKNCHWRYMFYSMMIANHLKKKHEIENNFKYDLVIKTRFDAVFEPETSFYHRLTPPENKTLYTSSLEKFRYEFNRINFADMTFYGKSSVMDLACDYFNHLAFRLHSLEDYAVGPGVGLYKYLTDLNVSCKLSKTPDIILRRPALSNLSWTNIVNVHKELLPKSPPS